MFVFKFGAWIGVAFTFIFIPFVFVPIIIIKAFASAIKLCWNEMVY